MAFTIEEIENIFTNKDNKLNFYSSYFEAIRVTQNYNTVCDYLTGKTPTLGFIQADHWNYYFRPLINLLGDIEEFNENDALIFGVIKEPTLTPFLIDALYWWIDLKIIESKTESAFNAGLSLFKQFGITNQDIFFRLLEAKRRTTPYEETIPDSPVDSYLLNAIKSASKLIFSKNSSWNFYFLKLIEIARPEYEEEYFYIALQNGSIHIPTFISYLQGKYRSTILDFILNQEKHVDCTTIKFRYALELYELNKNEYSYLLVKISKPYLDYLRIHEPQTVNEHTCYFRELWLNDIKNIRYSAIAFNFLFLHNKEVGLQVLTEWFEQKVFIHQQCLLIIHQHLGDNTFIYFQKALTTPNSPAGISYYQDLLSATVKLFSPSLYLPLVWSFVSTKSKPIKQLVANIVAANDIDFEDKAIALLQHKNGETRQTAASILSYSSSTKAIDAIMQILNTEANETVRDILLQTVVEVLPKIATQDFVAEMINAANKRGKLDKAIEPWLDETSLPSLFYKDGAALNTSTVRFLLYRMSRVKTMCSDIEAKYVIELIDKEKSTDFALHLIQLFRDKEAKAELKWMMALSTMLGNDLVVDKIRITTNSWIEENRFKMAEYGVGALALQGSDKALRWVEWYSRKYRSKKANVGASALVALENAAIELGISTHELGDKIVPDFGFEGLFKTFEIDGQEYRAFIDSKFKIAFFNEDNKQLKALPANAANTLKDEFKTIAKEVRDIVKSQSPRLEYYLIIQRKWTTDQWQQFFLNNPIMFIYATKLVWGIYDNEGILQQTFICNDDTTVINVESDEIELPAEAQIGIVHPSQLQPEILKQWQHFLYKQSIEQVFSQLDRKLPNLQSFDLSKSILHQFVDKHMATGSTRSTLEKSGWHKGPTGDGGYLVSMNLSYQEKHLEAVLEVEGIGAGFGWIGDEKLGCLYVIDTSKIKSKWMLYAKDDTDEKLVPFNKLPQIFVTEMLAAIQSIKPAEQVAS